MAGLGFALQAAKGAPFVVPAGLPGLLPERRKDRDPEGDLQGDGMGIVRFYLLNPAWPHPTLCRAMQTKGKAPWHMIERQRPGPAPMPHIAPTNFQRLQLARHCQPVLSTQGSVPAQQHCHRIQISSSPLSFIGHAKSDAISKCICASVEVGNSFIRSHVQVYMSFRYGF